MNSFLLKNKNMDINLLDKFIGKTLRSKELLVISTGTGVFLRINIFSFIISWTPGVLQTTFCEQLLCIVRIIALC